MRGKWVGWLRIAAIVLLIGMVLCCAAVMFVMMPTLQPASRLERVQELQSRLAESNVVWQELDALWRRIEAGETVHCSAELLPRPYFIGNPGDDIRHSGLDNAAHQLNFTIRQLHSVADRWAEVCRGDNTAIDPQLVVDVRAILDDAASGLRDVAATLTYHDSVLTEDAESRQQE